MGELYQGVAPRQPRASNTTRGIVAGYHFVVAATLLAAIAVVWTAFRASEEDPLTFEVVWGLGVLFSILYSATGWGILKWKNWSRGLSLVLNWLNVIAAVINVARLRTNVAGAIGVVLSCLVLWWLSMPAVKLQFRGRTGIK
jgi:hypothetical protein